MRWYILARTLSLAFSGTLLLVGVTLLAAGAFGIYLTFLPNQGFMGEGFLFGTMMVICLGIPGLPLTALAAWRFHRAIRWGDPAPAE